MEGGGIAASSGDSSGLSGVAAWLAGVLRGGEAARLRDERSPCRLGIMACCKAFFCELCVTSMRFFGSLREEVGTREALLRGVNACRVW